MKTLRLASAAFSALLFAGFFAPACSSDDPATSSGEGGSGAGTNSSSTNSTGTGTDTTSSTGSGMIPDKICLLNNCDTDAECEGCSEGRNTCLSAQHRCVKCNDEAGIKCPDGEKCSDSGKCVPEAQDCPMNGGIPAVKCDSDADCAACDKDHQVCYVAAHKCVACTDQNTTECQSTQFCEGGSCFDKCPATCGADSDCKNCGPMGKEVHACNKHKCSQCSPTFPCPAGQTCTVNGTCVKACGIPGQIKGTCDEDVDCAGCDGGATECHKALNGGHGTCLPPATGCSELAQGLVLPEPFDKVTNLCSSEADCANVSVDYNVGKLLRDLTGYDNIKDANISYTMHACASVDIYQDKSCGVCVPCQKDSDCSPIEIDKVAAQAFGGLGGVAAAFLLDQLFGPNDHKIYMYCETVTADFGVCAPCPGLLNDCGVGGDVGGSGSCDHDTCTQGGALDGTCDPCADAVCAVDSYCCTTSWDSACVDEVELYCGNGCGGGGADGCTHGPCKAGDKLAPGCSSCTADVCAQDPYCCQTSWDDTCVKEVAQFCAGMDCAQANNECNVPSDCQGSEGCLWDNTCGPCYADYDCYPKKCNTDNGQCQ